MRILIPRKFGRIITAAVITGWSIANYFVIEFHGSPLYFSELSNIGTAMAVIGGYTFNISSVTVVIFAFMVFEIAMIKSIDESKIFGMNYNLYLPILFSVIISIFGIKSFLAGAGAGVVMAR